MSFQEKIEIIKENGIDFLDYGDIPKIINSIIENPKLQNELLQVPDSFWEDAKNGLLVYSDYINYAINEPQPAERIVAKYHDLREKRHIPALVYQKRMEKTRIR